MAASPLRRPAHPRTLLDASRILSFVTSVIYFPMILLRPFPMAIGLQASFLSRGINLHAVRTSGFLRSAEAIFLTSHVRSDVQNGCLLFKPFLLSSVSCISTGPWLASSSLRPYHLSLHHVPNLFCCMILDWVACSGLYTLLHGRLPLRVDNFLWGSVLCFHLKGSCVRAFRQHSYFRWKSFFLHHVS